MLREATFHKPLIEVMLPEKSRACDIALVFGTSLLLALSAQVVLPLPFSPVPITLQTMVVLLAGAVLGSRLGGLSVLVYIVEGAVGLPFFAKGAAGLAYLRGVTGGYLLGFIAAGYVVGVLVENGFGRKVSTAVAAMFVGNVIIYACGLPWLARMLNLSFSQTLTLGLYPFLVGDLYKIGLASAWLPVLWRFFNSSRGY